MRWRAVRRTDLYRIVVSGMVVTVATLAVIAGLVLIPGLGPGVIEDTVVAAYLVVYPLYVLLYVSWSYRVYSRLDSTALTRASISDDRDEHRRWARFLGANGATNTTISAAVVSVAVTIAVAQRPEFRGEELYIALALLTVASSWVLMVFSFAQSYLRLGVADGSGQEHHLRFQFDGPPRFSDYFTLALLASTMAVTMSATITTRKGWRVLRTNVVIAFVFNSVIIAMMVSLLFGGLLQ